METELWQLEKAFWTEPDARVASRIAEACVMIFPPPAGILAAPAAAESLEREPAWDYVLMAERQTRWLQPRVALLAYRAAAVRRAQRYQAYCSSSYRLGDRGWQLAHHQQTPIG